MRLNNPLTTSFSFLGKEFPINLAFDHVLDVFEIIQDESLILEDKIELSILILVGEVDLDILQKIEMFKYVYDEYLLLGQHSEVETDELGNELPTKINSKDIDLVYDAKYIYASFRQIGINLFEEQGKMSWEEFQALLESLPDNCIMQRIIQIRNWEPQKGESSKEKRRMRELKRKYALPNTDLGEEEEDG
ncbi:hypothetical protein P9705_001972 [Enterococcus faecalis]|nr:hypothetical protein [Enterococcus faecalis]